MECPNLRELFGEAYRLAFEESYHAEHGENARVDDPWLQTIPGRFGHVFPWSEKLLAVSVDGHPKIASVVRKLDFCQVEQDGDFGELSASFPIEKFAEIAKIIRAHRRPGRRELSPEEKEAAIERLRKYRFRPQKTPEENRPEPQEGGQDDLEVA